MESIAIDNIDINLILMSKDTQIAFISILILLFFFRLLSHETRESRLLSITHAQRTRGQDFQL
jgi:hypothetical protein